jgi:hypothetical protein
VHSAVLPAGVPERATDFFGLNANFSWLSSVPLISTSCVLERLHFQHILTIQPREFAVLQGLRHAHFSGACGICGKSKVVS